VASSVAIAGCYTQLQHNGPGVEIDELDSESSVTRMESFDDEQAPDQLVVTPEAFIYVLEPPSYAQSMFWEWEWYQPPVRVEVTVRNRGREEIAIEGAIGQPILFVERKAFTTWVPFTTVRPPVDEASSTVLVAPGDETGGVFEVKEPGDYRIGVRVVSDDAHSQLLVYSAEVHVVR
jgi:hypothetical protein